MTAPLALSHGRVQVRDLSIEHVWQVAALATSFIVAVGMVSFTIDTWWALKMGELSISAGRPVVDIVMAHAPADPAAANGQWLAQATLYLLYTGTGESGTRLAAQLLTAVTFSLVLVAARVSGGSPRSAAVGVLLATLLASQNLGLRAQLFSYPIFALTYLVIQLRHQHPRMLYSLPVVFAVWANLHGTFALGLLLVGVVLLGDVFDAAVRGAKAGRIFRGTVARLAIVLVASVLATWINPLGPGVYSYLMSVTTHPGIKSLAPEWQQTTIQEFSGQAMAASVLLLFCLLRASRRPVPASEVLLLISFGYLALASLRNVVWWGFVLAPIMARHAAGASPPAWTRRWFSSPPPSSAAGTPKNLALVALILALTTATPLWATSRLGEIRGSMGFAAQAPVEAADFLASQPSGGLLYNFHPWTGYLAWRLWPDQQPMMEVRFGAFPASVWEDYAAVHLPRADWESVLDRYDVGYLVLHAELQSVLVRAAEATGRWNRVYDDGTALVLAR